MSSSRVAMLLFFWEPVEDDLRDEHGQVLGVREVDLTSA